MKKSKFTPRQIAGILREHQEGGSSAEIAKNHGVSKATLYKWRKLYGGTEPTALDRLRELEEENRRLRAENADLALDLRLAKEIIEKKL